jgi:hypothetical protein
VAGNFHINVMPPSPLTSQKTHHITITNNNSYVCGNKSCFFKNPINLTKKLPKEFFDKLNDYQISKTNSPRSYFAFGVMFIRRRQCMRPGTANVFFNRLSAILQTSLVQILIDCNQRFTLADEFFPVDVTKA